MQADAPTKPLIGLSTFGNLQVSVDRITHNLEKANAEIIHFHASGPGGRALESLTRAGELQGLIDLTTSELTDHVAGGVYSAGADRMTAAAQTGLPQVVVPGCLDFSNWWVGEVPHRYHHRQFFQYNQEIILMRTSSEEYQLLADLFVDKLARSGGPLAVVIPKKGFSQMTEFETSNIHGNEFGPWHQPACDAVFSDSIRQRLGDETVLELDLHINDAEFSEHLVRQLKQFVPQLQH